MKLKQLPEAEIFYKNKEEFVEWNHIAGERDLKSQVLMCMYCCKKAFELRITKV